MTDELYEFTGANALFATSGGTVALGGAVAPSYVVHVGDETHVCVAYARTDRLVDATDPLVGDGGVLLGETTLSVWDGRLVANCRLQGFEGRGPGAHFLAWGDGRTWAGGRLWELDDPGCNVRMIGALFVHPERMDTRAYGEIMRLTPPWEGEVYAEVVATFGEGASGYSDATVDGDKAVVVFERDRGLWEATVRR